MGEYWWEGDAEQRGIKGREKKWDNCNSIINKIYIKTKRKNSLVNSGVGVYQRVRSGDRNHSRYLNRNILIIVNEVIDYLKA